MMIRNSCKTDHSTHPCGHLNIKLCGCVNTKAQGLFPHSDWTGVSKISLLSSYAHIRVHLGISGKSFIVLTLQVHISFFKNLFVFRVHCWLFSFLSLLFVVLVFIEKFVLWQNCYPRLHFIKGTTRRVNDKKTMHKALYLLFQINHRDANTTIC